MKNIFVQTLDTEASNILYTTHKLLQELKVKVSFSTLRRSLLSHPHYLSLLSITETLHQFKVEAAALYIEAERLHEIEGPFMAYLSSRRKFIVITNVSAAGVDHYNESNDRIEFMTMADLRQQWNHVILFAEATAESGDKNYRSTRRKELLHQAKIPVLLGVLLIAGLLKVAFSYSVWTTPGSLYVSIMLLCKLAGIMITTLLLLYEYDEENSLVKQICSVGKKTNCSAVLNSSAASIAGISWSEAGFIYFFGGYIILLIAGTSAPGFVYWLNILALPYILFSIYYQAFKIKQWCILCLTVQLLLIVEFLDGIIAYGRSTLPAFPVSADLFLLFFIAFFFPAFTWFFAKPFIYQAKNGVKLQYQMARFKNNTEIFYATLLKQPVVSSDPHGLGIVLGNPAAQNTLIKVCNPYCSPCAKAHPAIDALIQHNSNWKVQIIFAVKAKEVGHLMAIAAESELANNGGLTHRALKDWYHPDETKTDRYTWFLNKYPVKSDIAQQDKKVEDMYNWCHNNMISHTPTFFVNGYRLPEQYEITDLQYL